jgi:hypothetical protein
MKPYFTLAALLLGTLLSAQTICPVFIGNDTTLCAGSAITLSVGDVQVPQTGVICGTVTESGTLNLSAPAGTVFTAVQFASYGTPNGSCGSFSISGCHAGNSLAIVQSYAIGQNSISIPATNDVFGDPCFGTYKRLYVQLLYSSPVPPLSVLWSTGETTPQITYTPLSSGTISVSVTSDGISCSDEMYIELLSPQLSLEPSSLSACAGASLSFEAPSGFQYYSWSDGDTGMSRNFTESGVYTLSVTDESGCSASDQLAISFPDPELGAASVPVCYGELLGLAPLNPYAPGNALNQDPLPINALWSNGQTSSTILVSPLTSQWYSLQVSDGISTCEDSIFVEVFQPQIDFGQDTITVCGQNTPILSSPLSFASYGWSTGSTESEIAIATSGNYSLTVTDEAGCTDSDNVYVLVAGNGIDQPDTTICLGESILLSVSNFPLETYEGSVCAQATEGGFITITAPGNAAFNEISFASYGTPNGSCGNYTTSGCNAPNSLAIVQSQCLGQNTCTIQANNLVFGDPCPGVQKRLYVEANYSFYYSAVDILWSTGDTIPSIVITPQQDTVITLQVLANGVMCEDEIQVSVNDPNLILDPDTLSYCGLDSILLQAPAGFSSYQWSNGSSSSSTWVYSSEVYSLVVSDEAGCTDTDEAVVSLINAGIVPGDTLICLGESVNLEVQTLGSGAGGYYFNNFEQEAGGAWNLTNSFSIGGNKVLGKFNASILNFTLDNLLPHESITVNFDFYAIDSWDGNINPGPDFWQWNVEGVTIINTTFSSFINVPQCYPNNCPASNQSGTGNSGSFSPTCHPTPFYRYSISRTFAHNQPDLDMSFFDLGLQDLCDESWAIDNFEVIVHPDLPWTDLLWSTGENTNLITVSPESSAEYSVIISDGITTCYDTAMVAVNIPDVAFAEDSLLVCGLNSLALGLPQVFNEYAWTTGESTDSISVVSTGEYGVSATNEFGCTGSDNIYVYFTTMDILQSDTATCIGSEIQLTVADVSYPFEWSNGQEASPIIVTPLSDTLVTVTYVNGIGSCTDSIRIAVSDIVPLLNIENVSCFGLADGNADYSVEGGIGAYTENWHGANPSALSPGNYLLTISDSINCSIDLPFEIVQPMPLQAMACPIPPLCPGGNDGSISVFSTGGTEPYSIIINGGQPENLASGVYPFAVVDANNCSVISEVNLPDSDRICGCTYEHSPNYNALATIDDGSCPNSCPEDLNFDGLINTADLLEFLVVFGMTCEQVYPE